MNGKGHVLITGAAQRIGREIALYLAREGWDITLHYHTAKSQAEELAQDIKKMGRHVQTIGADLSDLQNCEKLVPSDNFYPLTALIHNASLFEHDEQDADGSRHRTVHFDAPLLLTKLFAAQCPKNKSGGVVFMLDNTPLPAFLSHYGQSRAALRKALPEQARLYAPHIRVNALAAGPSLKASRESQEHFDALIAQTPLRRASDPAALAAAMAFLLDNPAITGQILNVDSGMHLLK